MTLTPSFNFVDLVSRYRLDVRIFHNSPIPPNAIQPPPPLPNFSQDFLNNISTDGYSLMHPLLSHNVKNKHQVPLISGNLEVFLENGQKKKLSNLVVGDMVVSGRGDTCEAVVKNLKFRHEDVSQPIVLVQPFGYKPFYATINQLIALTFFPSPLIVLTPFSKLFATIQSSPELEEDVFHGLPIAQLRESKQVGGVASVVWPQFSSGSMTVQSSMFVYSTACKEQKKEPSLDHLYSVSAQFKEQFIRDAGKQLIQQELEKTKKQKSSQELGFSRKFSWFPSEKAALKQLRAFAARVSSRPVTWNVPIKYFLQLPAAFQRKCSIRCAAFCSPTPVVPRFGVRARALAQQGGTGAGAARTYRARVSEKEALALFEEPTSQTLSQAYFFIYWFFGGARVPSKAPAPAALGEGARTLIGRVHPEFLAFFQEYARLSDFPLSLDARSGRFYTTPRMADVFSFWLDMLGAQRARSLGQIHQATRRAREVMVCALVHCFATVTNLTPRNGSAQHTSGVRGSGADADGYRTKYPLQRVRSKTLIDVIKGSFAFLKKIIATSPFNSPLLTFEEFVRDSGCANYMLHLPPAADLASFFGLCRSVGGVCFKVFRPEVHKHASAQQKEHPPSYRIATIREPSAPATLFLQGDSVPFIDSLLHAATCRSSNCTTGVRFRIASLTQYRFGPRFRFFKRMVEPFVESYHHKLLRVPLKSVFMRPMNGYFEKPKTVGRNDFIPAFGRCQMQSVLDSLRVEKEERERQQVKKNFIEQAVLIAKHLRAKSQTNEWLDNVIQKTHDRTFMNFQSDERIIAPSVYRDEHGPKRHGSLIEPGRVLSQYQRSVIEDRLINIIKDGRSELGVSTSVSLPSTQSGMESSGDRTHGGSDGEGSPRIASDSFSYTHAEDFPESFFTSIKDMSDSSYTSAPSSGGDHGQDLPHTPRSRSSGTVSGAGSSYSDDEPQHLVTSSSEIDISQDNLQITPPKVLAISSSLHDAADDPERTQSSRATDLAQPLANAFSSSSSSDSDTTERTAENPSLGASFGTRSYAGGSSGSSARAAHGAAAGAAEPRYPFYLELTHSSCPSERSFSETALAILTNNVASTNSEPGLTKNLFPISEEGAHTARGRRAAPSRKEMDEFRIPISPINQISDERGLLGKANVFTESNSYLHRLFKESQTRSPSVAFRNATNFFLPDDAFTSFRRTHSERPEMGDLFEQLKADLRLLSWVLAGCPPQGETLTAFLRTMSEKYSSSGEHQPLWNTHSRGVIPASFPKENFALLMQNCPHAQSTRTDTAARGGDADRFFHLDYAPASGLSIATTPFGSPEAGRSFPIPWLQNLWIAGMSLHEVARLVGGGRRLFDRGPTPAVTASSCDFLGPNMAFKEVFVTQFAQRFLPRVDVILNAGRTANFVPEPFRESGVGWVSAVERGKDVVVNRNYELSSVSVGEIRRICEAKAVPWDTTFRDLSVHPVHGIDPQRLFEKPSRARCAAGAWRTNHPSDAPNAQPWHAAFRGSAMALPSLFTADTDSQVSRGFLFLSAQHIDTESLSHGIVRHISARCLSAVRRLRLNPNKLRAIGANLVKAIAVYNEKKREEVSLREWRMLSSRFWSRVLISRHEPPQFVSLVLSGSATVLLDNYICVPCVAATAQPPQ
eukprot:gnl/Chilomastix_cuspidata/2723.p1 GENE.gnl/Chilomastix_cuspidata/2723~~gnl/Chilomastix_cuspidata/2723.p1  ORF type:complete len:1650 (-),score=680.40 gnl/Chilomastix_cuspidata/2723:1640-6553(-)